MKQVLFMILIGISGTSWGQARYSLADCISYTLENHPSVKIYQNNVSIANEKARQNLSAYLPQISGVVTSTDNLSLQSSVITSDYLGPNPVVLTMGSQYTTTAYLDANQSIIDFSKIAKLKSGKTIKEKSALEKQKNEETIIYDTSNSFFKILIFREQLKILQTNKTKYEEMFKILTYQYKKGTILEKEVDRIKVNLNSVNYQIKDAETKLQLSYNTLKNTMGMPMDMPLEIKKSNDYEAYLNDLNDGLIMENMIGYKLSRNAINTEENNLRQQKAESYPNLIAVARFGYQALSNDFSNIYNKWNDFSYVGLSLNIPVFSGFKRKSQITESKLKLENEMSNFKMNKDHLQLAFENAKTSLGTAYSSYQSNQDNMSLAKKVLDVTDYQYQRGVASLTDYLNDDTAYKNAQSDYLNSLYNLLISELNYHQSKGTLKEFINQIQ